MNHLKVVAKLSEDELFMSMIVVDRTVGARGFGGTHDFEPRVFGHGNVRLRAKGKPHFEYHSYAFGIEVSLGQDHTLTPVNIPIKFWPEVKEAIVAYNEWGKNQ